MPTVNVDDFFPEILPDVSGAALPAVRAAIVAVAIEFCQETLALRQDLAPVNVVKDQADYAFAPPVDYEVTRVLSVRHDGTALVPQAEEVLEGLYQDWETMTGTPRYFTQENRDGLRLVPIPDADVANGLKIRAALQPTRTATTLDQQLKTHWLEAIKHGAISRLKLISGQPFSDPAAAAAHRQLFREQIGEAKLWVSRNFTNSQKRVMPRFY